MNKEKKVLDVESRDEINFDKINFRDLTYPLKFAVIGGILTLLDLVIAIILSISFAI